MDWYCAYQERVSLSDTVVCTGGSAHSTLQLHCLSQVHSHWRCPGSFQRYTITLPVSPVTQRGRHIAACLPACNAHTAKALEQAARREPSAGKGKGKKGKAKRTKRTTAEKGISRREGEGRVVPSELASQASMLRRIVAMYCQTACHFLRCHLQGSDDQRVPLHWARRNVSLW